MRATNGLRNITHVLLGIAMVGFGVPRLPHFKVAESGLFDVLWLAFALLIVGANLFYLMGVDKEKVSEKVYSNR